MVAFNIADLPSLHDPGEDFQLDSLRRSHAATIHSNMVAALSEAVGKIKEWLNDFNDAATKHESVYEARELRVADDVLRDWSDEQVLDRIHQFGLVAEVIRDWADIITQNSRKLKAWKSETGIWNAEAESLVTRLDRLVEVFQWNNPAIHGWVDQLCEEFERRNPDLGSLPAEPLDLGPTNAARLPQVL